MKNESMYVMYMFSTLTPIIPVISSSLICMHNMHSWQIKLKNQGIK